MKKVFVVLLVIILAFVVVVALQPADFQVSRTINISAPAPTVFELVNDFHKWENWSPWAKLDPNAQNSFAGPTAGAGSIFRWSGNTEVGEGSMIITESEPNERVLIQLVFVKPFKATNFSEFTLEPNGDQTQITWSMSGKNNFMAKAVGLFMDCDTMIGGQFEQGLANIKSLAESTAKPQ